jgi:Uma2 family endonuclease
VSVVAPGDYLDELPRTASLVVEAANDSLQHDRTVKGRLYAEAGIPEYWLVDLERKRVERYLAPSAGVYTQLTTHGPDETLSPLAFPDVRVPLAEILPR